MTDPFRQWIEAYGWPITAAVTQLQEAAAWEMLELAKTNMPSAEERPDDWEGIEVAVIWFTYLVKRVFAPDEQAADLVREFSELLETPRITSFGEQQRLKTLLVIRLDAESLNCAKITRREIDSFLEQIESPDEQLLMWHHLISWAFINRDRELAARGVEVMLAKRKSDRQPAAYRRAVLIHALLDGTATTESLKAYCTRLEGELSKIEFIDHFLPLAEEMGLVDDALRQQVQELRLELSDAGQSASG